MHWVLQNNIFRESAYDSLIDTLKRLDIPHSEHRIIPFIGEITEPPQLSHNNVICMGSYSMRHYAAKMGWNPGVFDLEPFDFTKQLEHWGDHMLNADSVVGCFGDAETDSELFFIRPILDSKSFSGSVMSREQFYDWKHKVIDIGEDTGSTVDANTMIQIAPLKEIYTEHRFWVVDGRVITGSTYKLGSRVTYHPVLDQHLFDYVNARIAEWMPLRTFCIDIAYTPDGLKVIEINTLNSSGFYAADMQKLVEALQTAYSEA